MLNLETLGSSSKGNCYIIRVKGETLLIEAGLTYKKIAKALNFEFTDVVGCLISHEHKDHSKAVPDLCKAGIEIYCSPGTQEGMKFKDPFINLIHPEEQFNVGSFTVLPFLAEHNVKEPLGFLIYHEEFGKLLFITDSFYCRYKFKGLNYIMLEVNYCKELLQKNFEKGYIPEILRKRILTSHFSLHNAKLFLSRIDLAAVKEIMLIHLSDGNSDAKRFVHEIKSLTGKPTRILV